MIRNSSALSYVFDLSFEALLALHPEGFERVSPIINPYTICISAATNTLFTVFTVPAPAFKHSVDILDKCEEIGVINLFEAHSVYVVGIFPINFKSRMLIQLSRGTGPDIPFYIDIQALKMLKAALAVIGV
jgi:hypothetical protein